MLWPGCQLQAVRLPSLRRATRVRAAAPNRSTIGGAGIGVPPVEVELDVAPLEVELDVELDVEALVEEAELLLELVLLDVLVPPPKLLDEEVVETLPLDVVDETPPVEVEVEPPLVEDELPPVEVEVETPLEVETLPLEVETPPVEVETPLDVEVDPPVLETVMSVRPPPELPPKKPPAKKPPEKPPLVPPTTTGMAPPPLLAIAIGGGGGGANIGGMMVRVVTAPAVAAGAAQVTRRTVRLTTRRLELARRTVAGLALACLTTVGRGGGFSARETAPPPMIAPPQVHAQSFARAILTDITSILPGRPDDGKWRSQYPSGGVAISSRCKRCV